MTKIEKILKDSEVVTSYEQLTKPDAQETWFSFTCSNKNVPALLASGAGGAEELRESMKDQDIALGFLRFPDETLALVCYTSAQQASVERSNTSIILSTEARTLFTHHFFLDVAKLEDVTLENIRGSPVEGGSAGGLKKRKTVKKKKGEDGTDLEKTPTVRRKKREKEEKERDEKDKDKDKEGEGEDGLKKRKGTIRKKKIEGSSEDISSGVKKVSIDDERSDKSSTKLEIPGEGMKRSKSVKKRSDDSEKKERRSEDRKKSDASFNEPTIAIQEAPLERSKSVKKSQSKEADLLSIAHVRDHSFSGSSRHSREYSASSDTSEDGRLYARAVSHNLARTEEDLMFIKGDLIQVTERRSDSCWVGICCGVEGTFHPSLVALLPPGYRHRVDASGSEISVDSFSDLFSDSEYDDELSESSSINSDRPATNNEFTEPIVIEWLYYAGFPQYVDMFQRGVTIDEGDVVKDHGFLSPLQLQSLLKRIRFLNSRTLRSPDHSGDSLSIQGGASSPISPVWSDPMQQMASTAAPSATNTLPTITTPSPWEGGAQPGKRLKKKSKNIYDLEPHEIDMARKLAVLSLTATLEKRSKNKVQNFALKTLHKIVGVNAKEEKYSEKKIFGVDLADLVERTGVPSNWSTGVIPKCAFKMLECLEKEEIMKTVGVFRVPGKQGRINSFKDQCDNGEEVDFASLNAADLSGLLKLFFKELPDSLFTSDLYKSYISVASISNKRIQIESLQLLSILLPKENRDLAACLLKLLSKISLLKDDNKMDARNIALVLAPTLFGDRRKKPSKMPTQAEADKDLMRQNKIAEVLQVMIECQSVLWHLPVELQEQLEFTASGSRAGSGSGPSFLPEKKKKWFFSSSKYPTL